MSVGLDLIPNTMIEYLYYLGNASLTLRVVQHLYNRPQIPVSFITVIHQINGWVIRIKLKEAISTQEDGDFRAFCNELGISYEPPMRLQMAFLEFRSRTKSHRSNATLPNSHCLPWWFRKRGN